MKEVDGSGSDGAGQLVGVGEVVEYVDVGSEQQHVLLAASGRQPQQLVQPAQSRTHHIAC